jgi:hypothetical protein
MTDDGTGPDQPDAAPPDRPVAAREPATEEEERQREQEELESFRRRQEWAERVLGDMPE